MKEKAKGAVAWIKARPKTTIAVALILVAGAAFARGGKEDTSNQITVVRGQVVQEVAVSGKTVAVEEVSLGFDRSGRVGSAPVRVGDRVSSGQVIASLEAGDLAADRAQTAALLSEELVKLEQIKRTSLSSYSDARASMIATIKNSYATADDALRNNIDQFFKSPRQSSTRLEFSFKDGNTEYNFPLPYELQISISAERFALESVLTDWEQSLRSIDSAQDLSPYIDRTETNLSRIKVFLNQVAFAANSIESVEFEYETTINRYKSTVSTARTDINTAINTFIASKEKLASAPTEVGGSGKLDEVAAQEARIASVRAQLQARDAQLAKAAIRAPFSGLITKQDAKVGETVTAGTPLVGLISDQDLEIEANVSEVNIGKVALGNTVRITFDAFPTEAYTGTVSVIEPAETIVDNVVNYKVKIALTSEVPNIKSGLTANLKIVTATKDDVLVVPVFSIIEDDEKTYVEKLIGDLTERVEVVTGLVGNNNLVEVSGNIAEGDIVLVSSKK